jgi:hypothetical protein
MYAISINVGEVNGGVLEHHGPHTTPLDEAVVQWVLSRKGPLREHVPLDALPEGVPDIGDVSVWSLFEQAIGDSRVISFSARCASERPSVIMGARTADFDEFVRLWLAHDVRSNLKPLPDKYPVPEYMRADTVGYQLAYLFAFDCLMHLAINATAETRALFLDALLAHEMMVQESIHAKLAEMPGDAYLLSEVDTRRSEEIMRHYPGHTAVLPKVRSAQTQMIVVKPHVQVGQVVIDDGALLCVQATMDGRAFLLAAFHGLSEGTDTVGAVQKLREALAAAPPDTTLVAGMDANTTMHPDVRKKLREVDFAPAVKDLHHYPPLGSDVATVCSGRTIMQAQPHKRAPIRADRRDYVLSNRMISSACVCTGVHAVMPNAHHPSDHAALAVRVV